MGYINCYIRKFVRNVSSNSLLLQEDSNVGSDLAPVRLSNPE